VTSRGYNKRRYYRFYVFMRSTLHS